MSELFLLQEQLQDTNAALSALEKEVAKRPVVVPSLNATARSLLKRQQYLEKNFLKTAQTIGVDVCTYRSFTATGTIKAAPAFASIAEFQNVFSVTYDAEKHGPKSRATLSKQTIEETAFEFGYGFMGSIGFVLTLSNERLLLGDTFLDIAMDDVFAMAKAKSPDDILSFARRLGQTPIRAVYKWAELQARAGIGADVNWQRGEQVRAKLFIQPQEMADLKEMIDSASEEATTDVEVEGLLTDAITSRKQFTLDAEGGPIHGTYADAIDDEHQVQVPGRRYRALLRKTEKTSLSTGEVSTTYHLLRLTPIE